MSKRMNILVAVALLATIGVVGCGSSDKPTAPAGGDTVPPAALVDLSGWVNSGQNPTVGLSWKAGAELDLAGYNIYRSENGGASELVGVVSSANYLDTSVQAGSNYVYQVSAYDLSSNEGPRASTPTLTVPNDGRTGGGDVD